jgi:hypothetical protein
VGADAERIYSPAAFEFRDNQAAHNELLIGDEDFRLEGSKAASPASPGLVSLSSLNLTVKPLVSLFWLEKPSTTIPLNSGWAQLVPGFSPSVRLMQALRALLPRWNAFLH